MNNTFLEVPSSETMLEVPSYEITALYHGASNNFCSIWMKKSSDQNSLTPTKRHVIDMVYMGTLVMLSLMLF